MVVLGGVVGVAALVDMDVQGDARKKMRKNKCRRWSRCSIVVVFGRIMYSEVSVVCVPGFMITF